MIAYIRVVDGTFTKGEAIRAMQAGTEAEIDDIGFFTPQMTSAEALHAGEVGFLITGHQGRHQAARRRHADHQARPATEPLPGYREVKPMVFCGLFPIDSDDYPDLRDALEKLTLNDAALSWEPETCDALGFGFRCGFLGLLHMDIVRERLEREYDLELLATMPSVEYEVTLTDGTVVPVHSPNDMPDPDRVAEVREPYIRASILTPKEFVGPDHGALPGAPRRPRRHALPVLRAPAADLRPAAGRDRARLLRPAEVAHPRLRVARLRADRPARVRPRQARHPARRRPGRRAVDARAPSKAYDAGRTLTEKLRKKIPRQQYDVPIQAAIGSRIVARETIKAYRKDVIAKCYGGDITRKRKLLEQQKKGKQRMKQVGRIEVPQEAFLAVLELGEK